MATVPNFKNVFNQPMPYKTRVFCLLVPQDYNSHVSLEKENANNNKSDKRKNPPPLFFLLGFGAGRRWLYCHCHIKK